MTCGWNQSDNQAVRLCLLTGNGHALQEHGSDFEPDPYRVLRRLQRLNKCQ
jgi:hypothetical protein